MLNVTNSSNTFHFLFLQCDSEGEDDKVGSNIFSTLVHETYLLIYSILALYVCIHVREIYSCAFWHNSASLCIQSNTFYVGLSKEIVF